MEQAILLYCHSILRKKELCYHSFVFYSISDKFISRNASSQMPRRIANTTHQHHYSSYLLIYAFCGGVVKDCEVPFSLNFVRLKNY